MDFMKICPNCCKAEISDGECPVCGYKPTTESVKTHTLPIGSMLASRYFLGKTLGEGGFGITYIGFDTRLESRVAVKEYYPTAFASREHTGSTHTVYPYSGEKEEYFKRGLDRFIMEAKRLSKFSDEPAVVNVRDFFSENGTAYIVMEFVDGDSLKTVLEKHGRINEKSALILIKPIIKALAKMHKEGIVHRDIAPDNIMIEPKGTARLIDFGAAMEQTGDNKSTIAMIKHGFAPEEQHDNNHSRQGSWTDVYAICATLYNILEGTVPTDSFDRLRGEEIKEFTADVSENIRNAIFKGLEISPKNRIQTMDELLRYLEGEEAPPVVPVTVAAPETPVTTVTPITPKPKNMGFIVAIAAALIFCIGIPVMITAGNNTPAIDVINEDSIKETTTTPETTTATTTEATVETTTKTEPETTTTTPPTTTTTETTTVTMSPEEAYESMWYEAMFGDGNAAGYEDPFENYTSIFEEIPDEGFRKVINAHFGRQDYKTIWKEEVVEITVIDVSGTDIATLKGIEYLTSLQTLICSDMKDPDFTITVLPDSITYLDIRGNDIDRKDIYFADGSTADERYSNGTLTLYYW
jgi:serine/threonine protein kinase